MKYHDLIRKIAKKSRDTNRAFAKEDVVNFFDLLQEVIMEGVEEEDKILVKGIFKIEVVERKGKSGHHNVRTGEIINIPSKKTVKITLLEDFKKECEKKIN